MTSSSITVQWEAVDCIHHNGDITGYSVGYGVLGSGSIQTMNISGGGVTEATISSLKSIIAYSIKVAAVNSAGIGVYSDDLKSNTIGKCIALGSNRRYILCFSKCINLPQLTCNGQSYHTHTLPSHSVPHEVHSNHGILFLI